MTTDNSIKRDLYCTRSHEWIDFHDYEAFIGITGYRLMGVKEIKTVEFVRVYGFKKRGEVLANIQCNKGRFQVRMPVDGNITRINNTGLLISQNLLLTRPDTDGWLAKILVTQPCVRKDLVPIQEYNSTFLLNRD
jgi:glycine cleavage system H lipoate-binding protein